MAAMSNEYMVVIRHHDNGHTLSYDFPTLEEATRTAANWRKYTHGHARVEVVHRPSPRSEIDSRRKLNPYLTFLLAWAAVFVGGVVLILTGAADAAWNALAQALTHPVVTDNAIGAAITITGLAVIRHLRTHPREK